jgi:VanZ family protein
MRMALLRRVTLWLPPLLLMGAIYFFSAQPDLNSGLGSIDLVARKLVHLIEYALLCVLWWRAFRAGGSPGRAALAAFLVSALYAVSDEYHQSFVEGRSGSPVDVAIDSAGAALAALRLRAGARQRRVAA